jgi:DNA-binding IscR family transcriptional regulator
MNSDFCVAVHGMVYLNHKNCQLSSEELAENICTNPARVRKVMAKLKKKNLVQTKEGTVGGYSFQGDPGAVTLADIADALDLKFVETSWHSGNIDMDCLVASGMGGLMDEIFLDLNQLCTQRLREITIQDLDGRIFGCR